MSINKILASHKDKWRTSEEQDFSMVINYKTPNLYCQRTKCAEKIQYIPGGKGAGEEYLKNRIYSWRYQEDKWVLWKDKAITHLWNRFFFFITENWPRTGLTKRTSLTTYSPFPSFGLASLWNHMNRVINNIQNYLGVRVVGFGGAGEVEGILLGSTM